jgi:hypothetical protein
MDSHAARRPGIGAQLTLFQASKVWSRVIDRDRRIPLLTRVTAGCWATLQQAEILIKGKLK